MDGFYTYFASNGFSYGSTWKNWESLSRFDGKSSTMRKFLTKKVWARASSRVTTCLIWVPASGINLNMYFKLICGADKTSIITPTDEPSPFSSKVMKLSWFSFSTKTFCQVWKEEQAALHSQCWPRLRRHEDPTLERSRLQRQVVWKYFVNKNNNTRISVSRLLDFCPSKSCIAQAWRRLLWHWMASCCEGSTLDCVDHELQWVGRGNPGFKKKKIPFLYS